MYSTVYMINIYITGDVVQVELKLSKMILDKKMEGIIDQENGVLVLFTHTSQVQWYTGRQEDGENH